MGSIPQLHRFPWRRAWRPTPVFLPGESLWTEEPGRLQSMGSQRVRHDWSNSAHMHARKTQMKKRSRGRAVRRAAAVAAVSIALPGHSVSPSQAAWLQPFLLLRFDPVGATALGWSVPLCPCFSCQGEWRREDFIPSISKRESPHFPVRLRDELLPSYKSAILNAGKTEEWQMLTTNILSYNYS